ncbi:MAG TPA: hypothetical protein V6D28_18535 [Leptolyngbyaceae cyanobacterium]
MSVTIGPSKIKRDSLAKGKASKATGKKKSLENQCFSLSNLPHFPFHLSPKKLHPDASASSLGTVEILAFLLMAPVSTRRYQAKPFKGKLKKEKSAHLHSVPDI